MMKRKNDETHSTEDTHNQSLSFVRFFSQLRAQQYLSTQLWTLEQMNEKILFTRTILLLSIHYYNNTRNNFHAAVRMNAI